MESGKQGEKEGMAGENPVILRIKEAEAEAKSMIEDAEREAAEIIRNARAKAQQISDEPIGPVAIGSEESESIKREAALAASENEKLIASMKGHAGKKIDEAAKFILSSLLMKD